MKPIEWENYRFSDGRIGVTNIMRDNFGDKLDEEDYKIVHHIEQIHPIKSRQVAAVLLGILAAGVEKE